MTIVVFTDIVWGRAVRAAGVRHAYRRHRGVWMPSLCGNAPRVLSTAAMEAEAASLRYLPACPECLHVLSAFRAAVVR